MICWAGFRLSDMRHAFILSVDVCMIVPKDLSNCHTHMALLFSEDLSRFWEGFQRSWESLLSPSKEKIN